MQKPDKLCGSTASCARLGGNLDRASDAPPGTTVIWRGFSRLADLLEGARIAKPPPDTCGQLRFTVEEVEPFTVWPGFRGRLNQIMLGLMAPDYLEREVFCCGPGPFMAGVREMLQSLGFDMAHYHEESFAAPQPEEVPVELAPPAAAAQITFAGSNKVVETDGTETVLAVAKRAGLNIPSSCNFGLCGTCKVQKVSGEVAMVHNGGISDDEIAAGLVLACCSRPQGNVVMDL